MTRTVNLECLKVPNPTLHVDADLGVRSEKLILAISRLERIKKWGRLGEITLSAKPEGVSHYTNDERFVRAPTEYVELTPHQEMQRMYYRAPALITLNTAEIEQRVDMAAFETGLPRETGWARMIDRSIRRGLVLASAKNLLPASSKSEALQMCGSVALNTILSSFVPWLLLGGALHALQIRDELKAGYKFNNRQNSLIPYYCCHADRFAVASLLAISQRLVSYQARGSADDTTQFHMPH